MSEWELLGWAIDLLYVIVGCVVAWKVLPRIYDNQMLDGGYGEAWLDRWMSLFMALLVGTFWPIAGLLWLVDRAVHRRVS